MKLKLADFCQFKKASLNSERLKDALITEYSIKYLNSFNEKENNFEELFSHHETDFDFKNMFFANTLVINTSTGKVTWLKQNFHFANWRFLNIDSDNFITNKYLYYWFLKNFNYLNSLIKQSKSQNFSLKLNQIKSLVVDLPDFSQKISLINQLEPILNLLKINQKILILLDKIIKLKIHLFFEPAEVSNLKKVSLKEYFTIKIKQKFVPSKVSNDLIYLKSSDLKQYFWNCFNSKKLPSKEIQNVSGRLSNYEIFAAETIVGVWYGHYIGNISWLKQNSNLHDKYCFNLIFKINDDILKKILFFNLIYQKNSFLNLGAQTGTANPTISPEQILNFKLIDPQYWGRESDLNDLNDIFSHWFNYQTIIQREIKLLTTLFQIKLRVFGI